MKVCLDFSDEKIAGLLCSGMEGGINYWAKIHSYIEPVTPRSILDADKPIEEQKIYKHIDYPLTGGAVVIKDCEDDKPNQYYTLNKKAIQEGLDIMAKKYPTHFGNFLSDNYDAITGDIFVQCCVFGKVIYG